MKTVPEINAQIENINQTIGQVQAQIVQKMALVEDFKKSNAKLIEQNLLKQRKPPSLALQRKKIFEIKCEIEELRNVDGRLREELESAKQNLHSASIKHRIVENRKAQDYHLEQIRKAQDLLSQYKSVIAEIESLQGHRNALDQLVRINSEINGTGLADYGIDLGEVLTKFNQAKLSCDLDFSRIENLNFSLENLINQLVAIHQGKRGFHKVQAKKAPTVQKAPHVDPLRQARLYEKYRVESEDDLRKALNGKKQIIHHNHW
jgi:hypothetical protein